MPEPRPAFPQKVQSYITLKRFAALMAALAVLGFVLFALSHRQLKQTQSQLALAQQKLEQTQQNPGAKASEENKELVAKVGQLVILPGDEDPTIATVTDLSKLQDQPFFAQAQVGDKVLIYNNAKKAILYRPSTNKVISIAPLNIGESSSTPTSSRAAVSIVILNGSGTSGQAKKAADKLKAAGYNVSRVGDAASAAQTTIQYKSGHDQEAASINQVLDGAAVLQPSATITEDIVITLGKNYSP